MLRSFRAETVTPVLITDTPAMASRLMLRCFGAETSEVMLTLHERSGRN